MADDATKKDKLPGNQGQFGAGDASEAYKPLEKAPAPKQPAAPNGEVQHQTNAGERS